MSIKHVAIGTDIRSKDGHSIGKVEHLILDGTTNAIVSFVADKGVFDSGRVVDLEYVASADDDAVHLSLSEDEAKNLPGFVEHEFFRFGSSTNVGTGAAGTMVNLGGSGNTWVHYGGGAGGLPSTGSGSIYPQAVVGNYASEVVGPLTASDIVLDHGTDVVDADGEKIGKVDDVKIDDHGIVQGFVVQEGFLFHHAVYVPMEWIAGVTHEHVRLNVPRTEVEQSKP